MTSGTALWVKANAGKGGLTVGRRGGVVHDQPIEELELLNPETIQPSTRLVMLELVRQAWPPQAAKNADHQPTTRRRNSS